MKLLIVGLVAAASVAAVQVPAAEAAARPGHGWDRGGDHDRWDRRDHRRWDRRLHRGWERGRHNGWRRAEWRGHGRYRDCYWSRRAHARVCVWRWR